MLHNESWLLHSNLFKKHWIVGTRSWVRDLGWFSSMMDELKMDDGWVLFGNAQLSPSDYINIVDVENADTKLYMYKDGEWTYMNGPVLFVIEKNVDETYIAGYAGDKKKIAEYTKKYDNPWNWPGINVVKVQPTVAKQHTTITTKSTNIEKFPVFFLSNGETNAEQNWTHLKRLCPRAERIDGITPRRNAFLQCAELANKASHFFVVTGKNKVTDPSIFDYIPDNTVPYSHIMFQARNVSNGLEYGHMAIGCYNTEIIKNTPVNFGLDLTEYGKIYPIPMTVSDAHFATTPYEAWRTAFRETVKLTLKDTTISNKWLLRWRTHAEGLHANWVLQGAADGHAYALTHKDNIDALLKTERWDWLQEYFNKYIKSEEI